MTLIVSRDATIKRLLLFLIRVYDKWVFKLYSILMFFTLKYINTLSFYSVNQLWLSTKCYNIYLLQFALLAWSSSSGSVSLSTGNDCEMFSKSKDWKTSWSNVRYAQSQKIDKHPGVTSGTLKVKRLKNILE